MADTFPHSLVNHLLRFSFSIVGGAGSLLMRQMTYASQMALLKKLPKVISLGFKLPLAHHTYHSFRGHRGTPEFDGSALRLPALDQGHTASEDVVVLFSGGKDCTYVAWHLARTFRRVHLVTMTVDTAEEIERSEVNVQRLREQLGMDKFVRVHVNGDPLFLRLHFQERSENRRRFGPPVESAGCVACHVVQQSLAIAYCQEHGIRWVASGVSPQSRRSSTQNRENVLRSRAYFERHGIRYTTPLWEDVSIDPVEELFRHGVIPDRRLGKPFMYGKQSQTQGVCPLGIWETINYTRYEFTRRMPEYLDSVERYRVYLEARCEETLRLQGGAVTTDPLPARGARNEP